MNVRHIPVTLSQCMCSNYGVGETTTDSLKYTGSSPGARVTHWTAHSLTKRQIVCSKLIRRIFITPRRHLSLGHTDCISGLERHYNYFSSLNASLSSLLEQGMAISPL